MQKKRLLIFILVCLIGLKAVSAYIDPGTGGMIIGGSIWPFVLVIFAAIGGFFLKFFKPIKKRILESWQKIKRKN